jgi:hypothetical protein
MEDAFIELVFLPHRARVLVFVLWFSLAGVLNGQVQPTDLPSSTNSSQSKIDLKLDKSDASSPTEEGEQSHRASFVAVPVPTSSPGTGTGVTLMAGYIFPLRKSDKVSPASVIGGAGLLTDNGTRAWAVGTELYFKEGRYHVLTGFAHGDLNYDFYGTGTDAGNAGRKFGINQRGDILFGEALRRVFWQFFIGPRLWFGRSTLTAQHLGENHPDLPPLGIDFDMRSIGFKLERDTTPNRFYPVKGSTLQFNADFFSTGLGGSFTFQTYRLKFNAYHSFDQNQVLAYNLFVCSTGGEAPFFGQCIFGLQDELRGYPAGRYIDKKMIATQAEYRRTVFWRVGMVMFAGLGEVAPSFSSFNGQSLLGSLGGGIRLNLSTKYHVNLRVDVAQGNNDHTFSMGIGEAF